MVDGRMGSVARQLGRLFGEGTLAGLSEGQLLERFADRRDEAAFEALLAKHGPMVLKVCRCVLGDRHEAEDAFQATFLVMARKAGSIRDGDLLAPWLHRVARRISTRAGLANARRRDRESLPAEPQARPPAADPIDRAAIHEELDRLPENDRRVVILCDLEGRTHAEAARLLRWPIGTVKGRLSRARDRLRRRLTRRGLAPTALGLAIVREASGAVSAPLHASTLRAAIAFAAGRSLVAGAVPAAASALAQGVLTSMFWNKIKVAAVGLAMALGLYAGGVGVLATPGPDEGDQPAPHLELAAEDPDIQPFLGTWQRVLPDGRAMESAIEEDEELKVSRDVMHEYEHRLRTVADQAREADDEPAVLQALGVLTTVRRSYEKLRVEKVPEAALRLTEEHGMNSSFGDVLIIREPVSIRRVENPGDAIPLVFLWGEPLLPSGASNPMRDLVLVDPRPDPAALDPYPRDAQGPQRMSPAILKREGDRLLICSATRGGPRPTEFRADPDAGHTLDIFERVEPEPSAEGPEPEPNAPEPGDIRGDWEILRVEVGGQKIEPRTSDGMFTRVVDVVITEDQITLPNVDHFPTDIFRDAPPPDRPMGGGIRRLLPLGHYSETLPYEIDDARDPKSINLRVFRGRFGELARGQLQGIYRLEGDTLELCFGGLDQPRPKAFDTEPGSDQTGLTLRRRGEAAGPRDQRSGEPAGDDPSIAARRAELTDRLSLATAEQRLAELERSILEEQIRRLMKESPAGRGSEAQHVREQQLDQLRRGYIEKILSLERDRIANAGIREEMRKLGPADAGSDAPPPLAGTDDAGRLEALERKLDQILQELKSLRDRLLED